MSKDFLLKRLTKNTGVFVGESREADVLRATDFSYYGTFNHSYQHKFSSKPAPVSAGTLSMLRDIQIALSKADTVAASLALTPKRTWHMDHTAAPYTLCTVSHNRLTFNYSTTGNFVPVHHVFDEVCGCSGERLPDLPTTIQCSYCGDWVTAVEFIRLNGKIKGFRLNHRYPDCPRNAYMIKQDTIEPT